MGISGCLTFTSLPREGSAGGSGPEEDHCEKAQDIGCHQLLSHGDVKDLGQLAAEFILEREQKEGHRDYARQQEEEEGAGGQLRVGFFREVSGCGW